MELFFGSFVSDLYESDSKYFTTTQFYGYLPQEFNNIDSYDLPILFNIGNFATNQKIIESNLIDNYDLNISFYNRQFFTDSKVEDKNNIDFDSILIYGVNQFSIFSGSFEYANYDSYDFKELYSINQFSISSGASNTNGFGVNGENVIFSTKQYYNAPYLLQEDNNFDSFEFNGISLTNQFLSDNKISDENNFDSIEFSEIFSAVQYLNIGLIETNDSSVCGIERINPINQVISNSADNQINLVNVYDSSVIISGANYRNLIRTGITGTN